jgi:hypothetical protein
MSVSLRVAVNRIGDMFGRDAQRSATSKLRIVLPSDGGT